MAVTLTQAEGGWKDKHEEAESLFVSVLRNCPIMLVLTITKDFIFFKN
jgi:hypothetical protein